MPDWARFERKGTIVTMKILFADDQIPDESIAARDIRSHYANHHPDWDMPFINGFVAMREAVRSLRNAGYQVVVVNTYAKAMQIARDDYFEIAIVDLGWFADDALTPDEREYAGWNICSAIEEANRERGNAPTSQIIHSNRFADDATLSMQASDKGMLPIYKNYSEANHEALRAAVKFIESHRKAAPQNKNTQAALTASSLQVGQIDRWNLYTNLVELFSDAELDEVCFAMGIDEESLRRETKPTKAKELIRYCERRAMLDKLVTVCRRQRPEGKW
jgi:ActR/RegA family two-component response regulator